MQGNSPTSTETGRPHIQIFDVVSVLLAPVLAFALRDPTFFTGNNLGGKLTYCGIGFVCGLIMLIAFDLGRGLTRFVSRPDVFAACRMALVSIAMTSVGMFTFTRLEDVPRSIPAIHLLLLISLLLLGRIVASLKMEVRARKDVPPGAADTHILLIGANRLAFAYLRLIDTISLGRTHVVAVLDSNPRLVGRSFHGRPIVAGPSDLSKIVTEFGVHGINIDHVLLAGNRGETISAECDQIERFCRDNQIELTFLADSLGVLVEPARRGVDANDQPKSAQRSTYFIYKRIFDLALCVVLFSLFAPIFLLVAAAIAIKLGWPVVFWQKRVGRFGKSFLVYKFRTMGVPVDDRGDFVTEIDRASALGRFLRQTRLDELPQLWNIFCGTMSFVGPRPLLLVDQPADSHRLSVLPGLTGWAQIHGGKLITEDIKGKLDDWYVEHASFLMDLQIILKTAVIVFTGDRLQTASSAISKIELEATSAVGPDS